MSRDWHHWYRAYDDPTSSLSRRRDEVRRQLGGLLDGRPTGSPTTLLSLCAGDGSDTLTVLAQGHDVRAVLVELDTELAERARSTAHALGLGDVVEVRTDDAGTTTCAQGLGPADVVMMCGVLGNATDADAARTVAASPHLLAEGGTVVWTRGARVDLDPTEVRGDPAQHVRALFLDGGFEEIDFVAPADASYRVGVHRLAGATRPYRSGVRMFRFV